MSLFLKNKRGRGASLRKKREPNALQQRLPQFRKALVSVLLLLVIVLAGLNSRTLIEDIAEQRIEYVVIEGELNRVTESDVQAAVFEFINRSMVAIDLIQIKAALESNAWINSARLRRKWPNTLIVNVTEEVPIARWGDNRLLNQEGRIFSPPSEQQLLNLAKLSGPEGSEARVMDQYQVFNQMLYPKNLRIASLSLNSRGAWSMQLSNEVTITVGSINPVARIRRFVRVYDELFGSQIAGIEGFDLRYEDGIAVRPKAQADTSLISMNSTEQ
ncbi:MAG: hypothetical protein CMQ38_04805 [Gammaproteobacteria bacterium]|nr:hypothetical protein [Gammaproteobacteria bacterium]